jgi:hypothetical protein
MKIDKKTIKEVMKSVGVKNPPKYKSLASTLLIRLEVIRVHCKWAKDKYKNFDTDKQIYNDYALVGLIVDLLHSIFAIEASIDGLSDKTIDKRVKIFLRDCLEKHKNVKSI